LELRRYFNWNGLLCGKTADDAWEACNAVIKSDGFRVWEILEKFKVEMICTTDDTADDLSHHRAVRDSGLSCRVLPAYRPSKALEIGSPGFGDYVKKLSGLTGVNVARFSDMARAMRERALYFNENGCLASDHALDSFTYVGTRENEARLLDETLMKAIVGARLEETEVNRYKTALLNSLVETYHELGWAAQFHISAQRNNSGRLFVSLGGDVGCDSISDAPFAGSVSKLLDHADKQNRLPKTILYTLNPSTDAAVAALAGCFQGGGAKSKIQFGSAWWFNDTITGMTSHMTTLANMGLLSGFIGMLTDSRSFLSYPRHEYFRRVLARLLGAWVENGEFPYDREKLTEIMGRISYFNAKDYFDRPKR